MKDSKQSEVLTAQGSAWTLLVRALWPPIIITHWVHFNLGGLFQKCARVSVHACQSACWLCKHFSKECKRTRGQQSSCFKVGTAGTQRSRLWLFQERGQVIDWGGIGGIWESVWSSDRSRSQRVCCSRGSTTPKCLWDVSWISDSSAYVVRPNPGPWFMKHTGLLAAAGALLELFFQLWYLGE